MNICRIIKSVDFSKFPIIAYYRKLSDVLTPILVILIHVYACINLLYYGERPIDALLRVQFACLILLLTMQIHSLNRVWFWVLLLANIIFVPISALKNIMAGFDVIYGVLFLSLLLFRQITLSRKVYLAIHLFTAVFLTWFVGAADLLQMGYYRIVNHMINPNMFGILSFACMLHWMCFFEMLSVKWYYRLLGQGLALILSVSFILESGCRSALVGLTLFVLLCLVRYKAFGPRFYQILSIMMLIVLAIFPLVYVRYSAQLDNVIILEKNLFSGREDLWIQLFEWIKQRPIFGNGITFKSSAHHILIELATCLGIVPSGKVEETKE